MAVVLRREELILRCEGTIDLSNVEDSTVGGGCQVHIFGQVGEWDKGLALRESRDSPFRYTKDTQSGQCQASLENFPAVDLARHIRLLCDAGILSRCNPNGK